EVRIAGEAGGDAVEPAVAPGASKGETIILFNGFPVRVQVIEPNDPARQALGPFVGRYLDNSEVVRIPPGEYIGNDKKRYTLGANGRISQGGNVSQGDYDSARRGGEGDATGAVGGGGPSRVGVQAPDSYGAALLRFKHYDALIERGDITAEDAADAWQRDFDEITANSRIAAERVAAEQRLQDTATRRGELQFDILRSSLPEGTNLNLGPAGVVPSNVVNMQDILTQGLPSLPEQYASIGDQLQPIAGLPEVAPRELPPASLLDPMLGLADKTAAGSMGFLA
ncbi:hypothetical protein LCGC14_1840410, partial [marine sediment metagenome]